MKEANFDRSENRGDAVQASKNKTLIGQVYGGGGRRFSPEVYLNFCVRGAAARGQKCREQTVH